MKKICIFLLVLFIPVGVLAKSEIIYGEEVVSNIPLDESKYELMYQERYYNTYQINREFIGYGVSDADYIDYEDYQVNKSLTNEDNGTNKYILADNPFDDITVMTLSCMNGYSISELKIYDENDELIPYYIEDTYGEKDASILNDGNEDEYVEFTGFERFVLTFDEPLNDYNYRFEVTSKSEINGTVILTHGPKNYNYSVALQNHTLLLDSSKYDYYYNLFGSGYAYINEEKLYAGYKENIEVLNIYKTDGDNLILDDYYDEYHYREYTINDIPDEEEKPEKEVIEETEEVEEIIEPKEENKVVVEEVKNEKVIEDNIIEEEIVNDVVQDIKPIELLEPINNTKVVNNTKKVTTTTKTIDQVDNSLTEVANVDPLSNMNDIRKINDTNKIKLFFKIMLGIVIFFIVALVITYIYVKRLGL